MLAQIDLSVVNKEQSITMYDYSITYQRRCPGKTNVFQHSSLLPTWETIASVAANVKIVIHDASRKTQPITQYTHAISAIYPKLSKKFRYNKKNVGKTSITAIIVPHRPPCEVLGNHICHYNNHPRHQGLLTTSVSTPGRWTTSVSTPGRWTC